MAQVFFANDNDPEMQKAYERARATFKFFWRELSWERRRIVPGLDMAAVKVPFKDPPEIQDDATPEAEQMWLSDVDFDGEILSGTLLNQPNWLRSIRQGDEVQVPLAAITDWMYVIQGRAYGGFTINAMRAKMSRSERAAHDAAWGLDFGDPAQPELMPADWLPKPSGGFFQKLFGGARAPAPDLETMEHPMAVNMVPSFEEFLKKSPGELHSKNDKGMTFLHQMALAGSKMGVAILVAGGADVNAVTNNGMTALQLAKTLGWKQVADFLVSKGAK